MKSNEKKAALKLNKSKIVSEIRKMFKPYGTTFVDLAVGKRSDIEALLNYYGAPLRFIGPNFHMIMADNAAITGMGGMGGEIDKLHKAHFAGSAMGKCDIKVLNAQAALVNALWLRRDDDGKLMSRFGVIYLVALTTKGWRITSAVNISE